MTRTRSTGSRLRFAAVASSLLAGLGSADLAAQAAPPAPPATPTTSGTAAPATPAAPAAPTYLATYAEAMEIGRATVRSALSGQVDSLVASADPANSADGDVRTRVSDGLAQISAQLGAERRVVAEQVMLVDGKVEYWRTSEFELVPVPIVMRVTMGIKGRWRGVGASTVEMMPAGEEVKP